ncbi:MAG: FHA domain-containing protein [Acidobacteria bacterium]|nr:MAG: FHA domain-containing protein [Acidobacteriota bacterium]
MSTIGRNLLLTLLLLPLINFQAALQEGSPSPDPEQRRHIDELWNRFYDTEDLKLKEAILVKLLTLEPDSAQKRNVGMELAGVRQLLRQQEKKKEDERQKQVAAVRRREQSVAGLEAAGRLYHQGRLKEAGDKVREVLKSDSHNQEALRLREWIDRDQQAARTTRTTLLGLGAAVLLGLGALLFLWVRKSKGVLTEIEGPEPGKLFKLEKEVCVVGSLEAEADFIVRDPSRRVSRRHCSLVKSGKRYFLVDHSTNGTLLNGRPVKGETVLLRRGDQIALTDEIVLRFGYR